MSNAPTTPGPAPQDETSAVPLQTPDASGSETIQVNSTSESRVTLSSGLSDGGKRTARLVVEEIQPKYMDAKAEEDADDTDQEANAEDNEDEGSNIGDLLSEYPGETEDIELVHSRLSSLTLLRLSRFAASLQRLCLRQNQITALDAADFQSLKKLKELDLYDNQLKSVDEALEGLENLEVLDLSFNNIRAVPKILSTLVSLRIVYFVQNKITKIDHLQGLGATLTSLELGGNRIRKIEKLDALVNLEELWLGKNKISKLENLSTLAKLKILSIQSNRITKIEGLEELHNLQEFYISHNGIERLEGLDNITKLRALDAGNNKISVIENVSHLQDLEEFWMSNNQIPNLHALESQLAGLKKLETVYLEGNPCQTNDMAGYRRKVILALPQLKQVDATFVKLS